MLQAMLLAAAVNAHRLVPKAIKPMETNPVLLLADQAQAERVAAEHDQFAEQPSHLEAVGTPFVLEISGTSLNNFYSDGVLNLSLHISTIGLGSNPFMEPQVPVLEIKTRSLGAYSFIGQNAFGAKATVHDYTGEQMGIALVSGPSGDRSGYASPPGKFEWTATLTGGEAKSASVGAHAVVEGKIAKLSTGKVTKCDMTSSAATLDVPLSMSTYRCFVGATVSRIAIVDGTGRVVKEWRD